jgi:hypothetical protein
MNRRVAVFLLPVLTSAAVARVAYGDATITVETPVAHELPAPGANAPRSFLGARGTIALGLDFDTGAANTGIPSRPLGIGVHPTLDVFVLDGLSIGGAVGFEYSHFNATDLYNYGGETRIGYALRLNDRLAIWPKISLGYVVGGVPQPQGSSMGTLEDLRIGANLPLLFTLGGHTMFELGPVASTDVWRTVDGQAVAREDVLGMRAGIVGWF